MLFEPAFSGGVIVDPKIIADEAKGRDEIRPQSARAQKAVLDPHDACRIEGLVRLACPNHDPATGLIGQGDGGLWFGENNLFMLAKYPLDGCTLPQAHACCDPTHVILAPGPRFRLERRDGVFQLT